MNLFQKTKKNLDVILFHCINIFVRKFYIVYWCDAYTGRTLVYCTVCFVYPDSIGSGDLVLDWESGSGFRWAEEISCLKS
jgi:hypothetical protein